MAGDGETDRDHGPTPKALRLTFDYEGMTVRLVGAQRVEMRSPPGERYAPQPGQSGFWVELRDREGAVLYDRVMHNPVRQRFEGSDGPEARTLRHYERERPAGVFQVITPDLPDAATLVMFSSPPQARYEPAVEIARFALDAAGLDEELGP